MKIELQTKKQQQKKQSVLLPLTLFVRCLYGAKPQKIGRKKAITIYHLHSYFYFLKKKSWIILEDRYRRSGGELSNVANFQKQRKIK
jgi:hypothetical protein